MDASSGEVLWSYDTTIPVATVGGGETRGGSLAGGTSPLAYHGSVIVESGYDFSNKMPGNALLVFEVDPPTH
jgi:polyvinyl alcohol dehydrogenase (cytochrome)